LFVIFLSHYLQTNSQTMLSQKEPFLADIYLLNFHLYCIRSTLSITERRGVSISCFPKQLTDGVTRQPASVHSRYHSSYLYTCCREWHSDCYRNFNFIVCNIFCMSLGVWLVVLLYCKCYLYASIALLQDSFRSEPQISSSSNMAFLRRPHEK
jgi:hypothetical protein